MIAHVDADSFFASVLVRKHPHLKGKPLLALGMGGSCVIAATYEAKAFGVKTGMRLTDARKRVPGAIEMPSDFRETCIASRQIESVLQNTCPVIEQMSIDEWYLDLTTLVGGVPKDPLRWATELQRKVLRTTALSVSIGVGPSKILAKMAGEYHKPAGVTAVLDDSIIEAMLRDRLAAAIPGIGSRTEPKAAALGWVTAWDIASAPAATLQRILGRPGIDLKRELLGEIVHPVTAKSAPPQSVSRCRSFRTTRDHAFLWASILHHTQYLILKMRRHHLACRSIAVWLRDGEYHHHGTHLRLPRAMDTEERIHPYLKCLFVQLCRPGTGYTQVGVCLAELSPRGTLQVSLFEEPSHQERDEAAQAALDTLRDRFGREVIQRGSALKAKEKQRPGMGLPVFST